LELSLPQNSKLSFPRNPRCFYRLSRRRSILSSRDYPPLSPP
ncbi:hypothetical protein SOVF_214690, partial [Spinacia oleracea]